jgi:hypothetical protein
VPIAEDAQKTPSPVGQGLQHLTASQMFIPSMTALRRPSLLTGADGDGNRNADRRVPPSQSVSAHSILSNPLKQREWKGVRRHSASVLEVVGWMA